MNILVTLISQELAVVRLYGSSAGKSRLVAGSFLAQTLEIENALVGPAAASLVQFAAPYSSLPRVAPSAHPDSMLLGFVIDPRRSTASRVLSPKSQSV
jgi:hypothetical protein